MNFKVIIKHAWNKIRLYLSFLLFAFYLTIGCLFLFSDAWISFISKGRELIGGSILLFGIIRFYIAFRRYKHKHQHIITLHPKNKQKLTEEEETITIIENE